MSFSNDAAPARRPGFWKRQFQNPLTEVQVAFDISFGIVFPVACAAYDLFGNLGLFKAGGVADGPFARYSIYFYSEMVIGTAAMGYYLISRRPSSALAGVLFAGGVFSLLVGIILLPFSLIGLLIGIGVFGFTPLVSSFVFFRSARRCWLLAREQASRKYSKAVMMLVFMAALLVPAIPEISANRIIDPPVVDGP